jgi:hypothetical protein
VCCASWPPRASASPRPSRCRWGCTADKRQVPVLGHQGTVGWCA